MSTIDILLRDFFAGREPPWRPKPGETVTLAAGDDVIVNICEDETAEVVHFYSSPGYLPPDAELDSTHETLEEPGVHVCLDRIYRHRECGMVLQLRTFPRGSLDKVSFREEMDRFVADCRALGSRLSPDRIEPDTRVQS
ncbi:MAG: type III secretion system chaperone [Pseudomonadota bacterium]